MAETNEPKQTRRAEKKAGNRAALIAAARDLMIRDGYRETLLDSVAAQVGLTKGAIYSIFGGKRQLLRALIEEGAAELAWPSIAHVLEDGLSLQEQARRIADEWGRLSGMRVPMWAHSFALEVSSITLRDPELFDAQAARMREHVDELAAIFSGATSPAGHVVTDGGAEAFASAFAALMQGLSQRVFNDPSESAPNKFADAAVALAHLVDATPGATRIP
ncbi:TetR/AcrR family transcriptional regulator [Ilumatobacter sp.]|uniref:TetR/AcrR family transcriptional regulator n=1 Tax=Ilumatobacter sp. TaxID=1967498 RepID=UPI003B5180F5